MATITIDIEVLVIILIGLIFLLWFLWLTVTKKISQWRYKPENDKGKIGEEHRQELIRQGFPDPNRTIAKSIVSSGGQGEPEGRSDVPSATSYSAGENSHGTGKKSGRGIFRRLRRR